jgi:glycosyltransferase involved in cell wall biosynthesis
MTSVVHLTSAHTRFDTRIFLKMARSLAAAGYTTSLVVADGQGDGQRDGVKIMDAGPSRGRLDRMLGATRRVADRGLALDADLYHIHDPELLPAALRLKGHGKRVIFDAHEDLPRQILSKPYLLPVLRRPVSLAMSGFERFACKRLDHVIGATPAIAEKFSAMGVAASNINNYPILGELESTTAKAETAREVCYVGGIGAIRGIAQVISAMGLSAAGTRLNLAGAFPPSALRTQLQQDPGWSRVNELGFLDRNQVGEVLGRSAAGLVTFLPEPNHIESQPNKMFEYMSAGLPVIASNFPLWREIIEGNACGICVDPLDPKAIAAAIDRLVSNPEMARRMGENGRKAVHERYNWSQEEKRLLALYESLLAAT